MEGKKVIAVGADDVYHIATAVCEYLKSKGFTVVRLGSLLTNQPSSWVDVAEAVARMVQGGEASFGILICYTGTGVCITANKFLGIRAALCNDAKSARCARLWNDANVLVLSGRLVTDEVGREILDAWLSVSEPDPSEADNIAKLKRLDELLRR
jgi:ribose 5-phosphate isomerase B